MKSFIIIQLLTGMLLFSTVHAQEGQWETYMAKFDNRPGSVLVDLSLIDRAPDKRFPYLVVTGPVVQKCDINGLPDTSEIEQLEDILDATDKFITGVTPKVLAGTLTYNCERVNYYYVKDTMGLRNAIGRLYNRNYKNYNYAISIRPDVDWRSYRTFLYPNEETFNWIENNKIMMNLLQQGDNLSKERHVSFTLYFSKEEDRKAFIAFAHSTGYDIVEMNHVTNGDMPYELKISKLTYVKTEIKSEVLKYKATYNGWESELIKN